MLPPMFGRGELFEGGGGEFSGCVSVCPGLSSQ